MTLRLAHGLAIRDGRILLVASTYASHSQPLWNLPGGRVEAGELLRETLEREIGEETSLQARAGDLAYLSESYDGDRHVLAAVFHVEVGGEIVLPQRSDHVVDARWESVDALHDRIAIAVVREPLVAYLRHQTRYFGTHDAGVSIRWND